MTTEPALTQLDADLREIHGFVPTAIRRGLPPTPLRQVLAKFNADPARQVLIQAIAGAAAARHIPGAGPHAARWEALARRNAQRLAEREHRLALAGRDQQVFEAAAAVALTYTQAKGLPDVERLEQLSEQHLPIEQQHRDNEAPEPDRTPETSRTAGVGAAAVIGATAAAAHTALGDISGETPVEEPLLDTTAEQVSDTAFAVLGVAAAGPRKPLRSLLDLPRTASPSVPVRPPAHQAPDRSVGLEL